MALGGKAGVQLGHAWDVVVSRNTLLRLLRKQPTPSFPTPRVLGVDDFALRKRQTYGTVLIDLERRQPVDLLPDRTADTVAQWLREHPGGQVIARDRSSAYAEGARQGAPTATQVADRFHVLQNLREALDQVFSTHGQALDAVNATMCQQPVPLPAGALAVPVAPHDISLPAQQRAAQRQARRQALHTQVWTLHRQGWTAPAIAQQVGLSLRTVQRDLRSTTFAGRKRRSNHGDSLLNPYTPSLLERWNAGCYIAMRLFRELQQQGYTGSYGLVAAYARGLRQAQGLAPGQRCPRRSLPHVVEPVYQPLTPRRAAWLVLRVRPSAPRPRRSSWPNSARSQPRSPRPSTWPRTVPRWSVSGSRRSSIHGSRVRPPVRWRPCDASLPDCMRTMKPSKPAPPCPGARAPSRDTSTA